MANKIFLLRDDLEDTAGATYPVSYFWSPDIIVHDRMENPVGFLSWSYRHDVSQPLPPQGGDVPVYVRVKNVSPGAETAYVHLYAISPDLFAKPGQWAANRLHTADGKDCSVIPNVQAGGYGVTENPFVFPAGKADSRMLLAVVTNSGAASLPSSLNDAADFAYWVRENSHVGIRIPEIRNTEFMLAGKGVWNFRIVQPEQVRRFTFRIELNEAFPQGSRIVCTSPFFERREFTTEKGGTSVAFEGTETSPDKYGVVSVEYELAGTLRGEAMIKVVHGITIGADFYPVGCASVKYLQGASGTGRAVRNLDLGKEDDRYMLRQRFVTEQELQNYPKLRKYLKAASAGADSARPGTLDMNGASSRNRMISYAKADGPTVSYVSDIALENEPACCAVKMEAFNALTGDLLATNVIMSEKAARIRAGVNLPKSRASVCATVYTTLIAVEKGGAVKASVAGQILAEDGAVESYTIEAPRRTHGSAPKYVNVSYENKSTCAQEESDYRYNIRSHYYQSQLANRNNVPFFLPMKGTLRIKDDYELYPAEPSVLVFADGHHSGSSIRYSVDYKEAGHNKIKWTFDGNRVSWEFLEDWGDYIPASRLYCSNNHLALDAQFVFKAAPADVTVSIVSDENPDPDSKEKASTNVIHIPFIHLSWGCLAKGTLVSLSDGTKKRIEDIRPGDTLKGRRSESVEVEEVTCGKAEKMAVVRTEGGNELHLTLQHLIETGRGVIPAGQVNASDLIRMEDGTLEPLDWLLSEDRKTDVYDLRLAVADSIMANGIVTGGEYTEQETVPVETSPEAMEIVEELKKLVQSQMTNIKTN